MKGFSATPAGSHRWPGVGTHVDRHPREASAKPAVDTYGARPSITCSCVARWGVQYS